MRPTDTGSSEEDEQILREAFSGPDPMKPRKESSIERSFVKWCKENKIKQRKIEDGEGYPDRQIFLGQGRICCIEFKRPKGKARQHQVQSHSELATQGVPTLVTSDVEEAKQWVLNQLSSGFLTSTREPPRSSSTETQ